MRATIACLLFAAGSIASAESVYLRPPPTETEASVRAALPAVLRRCQGYGYKGIKADVESRLIGPFIKLTSPGEISPEMRATLARLFALSGREVDFVLWHQATPVELEQFRPGGKTAPPGTVWTSIWNCEGSGPALDIQTRQPVLPIPVFRDQVIPRAEFVVTPETLWVEMPAASLKLHNVPLGNLGLFRVDGKLVWWKYAKLPKPVYVYQTVTATEQQVKCSKCDGKGKITVTREKMTFGTGGSLTSIRETIACPDCSGEGSRMEKGGDFLRLIFDDRVAFEWVAHPIPLAFLILVDPGEVK